jgi:hypothetical protein
MPLAELPSSGAASQDDFPTQRQLARHLSRHSGPAAALRALPAGDQLPPIVAAQARGRAAVQIPYATGLTAGTTWSRDQHGASLDPTRKLHYRPMAALFHLWVPKAARIRRDELALTLCQWAGMTGEPARTNGRCRCGQDLRPLWSPPAGISAEGLVPVVPPDLAGLLHARSGQYPWREGGHHHSPWPAARDDDEVQTTRRPQHRAAGPRALRAVTVPHQHHGHSRTDA